MLRALALLAALAAPAAAQVRPLYSDAALVAGLEAMGSNVELTVSEDIVGALPRSERPKAAAIGVVFEARGPHPLAFWSRPDARTVHVPLESLLFLDDLAILTAWFEARRCPAEFIQSYLWALLRDGQPLPPPLEAFALERATALADPFVADVSAKILNSAVLFILAHEVGHLMHGHVPGIAGADSQAQEMQADAFALDHFAAIGAAPTGATVWFLAARWLDPTGAAARAGTHPVSPDRLRAMAARLAAEPEAFAFAEPDPPRGAELTLYVAGEMEKIAAIAGDEQVLTLLPLGLNREFPLSRLPLACPG